MNLFFDGFDHYATGDMDAKWTTVSGVSIAAAAGRRSSAAAEFSTSSPLTKVTLAPSTATQFVMGAAFKFTAYGVTQRFMAVRESDNTQQLGVGINADGTLYVARGSTGISSSTALALSLGVWYFIELKGTIHDSTGSYELRVNNVTLLSGSGVDTRNGGTGNWTQAILGGGSSSGTDFYVDDFYVNDLGGSFNNDFLGDVRVDTKYVTAEGNSSAWTPSTGTNNAALIDETSPNGDTDYVSASAASTKDTYTHGAAAVAADVLAVQLNMYCTKTDAGGATLRAITRHGTTDYNGTTQAPGVGYSYLREVLNTNPGTGAFFTQSGFDNAEFGFERVT